MAEYQPSRELVLSALNDHRPKSNREIVEATGLSHSSVYNALALCWRRGLVLRTAQPIYEHERVFKERGGLTQTTRPYHLYLHKPEELDSTAIEGDRFVGYDPKHLDARGGGKISKAQRILILIQAHRDKAFFSAEIADALADEDMKVRDVMSNIRRFEVKGPVYVRGYKTGERRTPFKRGYLITWLDPQKPRGEAIEEAIQWTDGALEGKISGSPFTEKDSQGPRHDSLAFQAQEAREIHI